MKRTLLAIIFIFAATINPNSVCALLVVSGDSNVVGYIEAPTYVDNGTFFENILQDGTRVGILQGGMYIHPDTFADRLNDFYNGLPGVTSQTLDGAVTESFLSNLDLFMAPLPVDQFALSEITALSNFYASGGSIYFSGDYTTNRNSYVNEVLIGLGSNMSIVDDIFGVSDNILTGDQIASDSLTSGIEDFWYAASSQVSGGTPLFFGEDNKVVIAYEAGAPVPEPATMLLFGSGLIGLAGYRYSRRKFKKK